jgi:hypothetical protein
MISAFPNGYFKLHSVKITYAFITLSDEQVVIWLVEAVIRFTGKAVSLANLQSMPVLYPFVLDQPLAYAVSSSKKLELRSEGVGGQFVALRD